MSHADVAERSNMLINTGNGEYNRYFSELDRMLHAASGWASSWQNYAFSSGQAVSYIDVLRGLFDLLHQRYCFETNDPLMIDRTASGFPGAYTMSRVGVDRENRSTSTLDAHALRDLFLDDLFRQGTCNDELRNEIARADYQDAITGRFRAFNARFMLSDFKILKRDGEQLQCQIVWGTFNQLKNVPCVHSMVFTYRGTQDIERINSKAFKELVDVLAFESQSYGSVGMMVQHIDDTLPDVSPEILSRVTIGPLHMPGITQQDDVWAPLLQQQGTDDDFLLEIVVDHVYAKATRQPHMLSGLGIGLQHPKQVFAINRRDQLCDQRGASVVERFICLTHPLARAVHSDSYELPGGVLENTTLITYTKEGEKL